MRTCLASRLLYAAALAGALVAPPASCAAQTAIGHVASLEGQASATHLGGATEPLSEQSPVFQGDHLRTAAGSKLQVLFEDDSSVWLGESSELTLDQYVYVPGDRQKVNCVVKVIAGLVRVITGKITDLNPERFNVNTGWSTIGIRGCELVFRVNPGESEDIVIVRLPEGRRIVIETREPSVSRADRVLNILQAGAVVSIAKNRGLVRRPLLPSEAIDLMRDTTPASLHSRVLPQPEQRHRTGAQIVANPVVTSVQSEQTEENVLTAESINAPVPMDHAGGGGGNDLQPGPNEPPPSNVTPNQPLPATLVAQGGGPMNDWYWGVWDDGSVDYYGTFLTVSEFQALIATAVPCNLSSPTPGQCGALLAAGTAKKLVQGTCTLNVRVNDPSYGNAWSGSFQMNNPEGDFLNFNVALGDSTIDSSGRLHLKPMSGGTRTTGYGMQVNGQPFGPSTITSESVDGQLTRNSSVPAPITGAAGRFGFHHGTAASANGAFGSDLQ